MRCVPPQGFPGSAVPGKELRNLPDSAPVLSLVAGFSGCRLVDGEVCLLKSLEHSPNLTSVCLCGDVMHPNEVSSIVIRCVCISVCGLLFPLETLETRHDFFWYCFYFPFFVLFYCLVEAHYR